MKDIFNIKDIMFLNFVDSKFIIRFFFILGIFIIIGFLYFIYKKYKKEFKSVKQKNLKQQKLKDKYLNLIKDIKSDDPENIYKLNFYIRDYFEKAGIMENSTKKTRIELKNGKKEMDDFFEICQRAEFCKTTYFIFEDLRNKGLEII